MDSGPWNWLEVAKLLASLLVPITMAIIGIFLQRITKRFEHAQWRSQKLIEKRLSIYDDIAPELNDILCYFTHVGCWKDLNPPDVVAMKRVLDKKINLAAPLFSREFYDRCQEFQHLCFETFTGWGNDAKLRTEFSIRKATKGAGWQPDWDACFSENTTPPNSIRDSYRRIMQKFSEDIGVYLYFNHPSNSQRNIKLGAS